jgi:ectoine hydroxylase-related dioxygenase (phytanoyl-CoA dioxygenase family)
MSYQPFIESSASAPAEDLRALMAEHGYLFFRALVPGDEVLKVRRAALQLCDEEGWLDPDAELMEGRVRPGMKPTGEGQADYMKMYRKLLKTPLFHAFPDLPILRDVAAKLLDIDENEVLTHPRRIGRVTFPHNVGATTPAHQDHFYIRGAVDTFSCWIPLGDCPMQLGNLAVWNGSHQQGFIEHTETIPGAVGGRGVPINESQADWHSSDFELGDVLFFHAFTIHKALPNLTENLLRVSTDNRYQSAQDKIEPDALLPHFNLQ